MRTRVWAVFLLAAYTLAGGWASGSEGRPRHASDEGLLADRLLASPVPLEAAGSGSNRDRPTAETAPAPTAGDAVAPGAAGPALSGDAAREGAPAGDAASSVPSTSGAEEDPALAAAVAEMTDIRGIKPPQLYGRSLPWLAAAILAAAAAALLGFWLWRKRRRSRAFTAAEPPVPPDVRALAALATLRQTTGLPDKVVYFELSSILRDYLDRRFQLDTLEMTTEELLPVIRELPARAELRAALADLFRFADPVKYADTAAGESQRASHLGFADDFVRATRAAAEAADV